MSPPGTLPSSSSALCCRRALKRQASQPGAQTNNQHTPPTRAWGQAKVLVVALAPGRSCPAQPSHGWTSSLGLGSLSPGASLVCCCCC